MAIERLKKNRFAVLYECNHTGVYDVSPPQKGDEVYCRQCADYTVVKSSDGVIWVRCDNCRYSRQFGTDRSLALSGGSHHVVKYPSHTVVITHGTDLVDRVSYQGQGSLPFAATAIERSESTPGHQRGLRDLVARVAEKEA